VDATSTVPFGTRADGIISCKTLSPPDYALRAALVELEERGELVWGTEHGEQAIYVLDGELTTDGRPCETNCALVIESGVELRVKAKRTTTFLHFDRVDQSVPADGLYGAPSPSGHSCHVVGPAGWFRCEHDDFNGVVSTWFADSTCPTCRVTLMKVEHPHGFSGPPHSHTQDEIIYVMAGSIQLGRHEYFAGSALCVPANTRYRVSYPRGGDFLNYRADASQTLRPDEDMPRLEAGLQTGGRLTADFR
jgi:quercetin dioxygenase-like cupin family protein